MSAENPWFEDVPPLLPSMVPILSPRGGASVLAILLSDLFVGRWCHFRHSRTMPCSLHLGYCEHCSCFSPKKFKGFVGAWLADCSRYCIVELTHSAMKEGTPPGANRPPFARGQLIKVGRRGESIRSRTYFTLSASNIPLDQLPEPFDVRRQLEYIWTGNVQRVQQTDRKEGKHGS